MERLQSFLALILTVLLIGVVSAWAYREWRTIWRAKSYEDL